MNYLYEIKRFYDKQMSASLSAGQISLWHALIEINNRSGWQEWFSAPDAMLTAFSGLGRSSIYAAREKLIELGYIQLCKRKYKICTSDCTSPSPHLINNKLNYTKPKKERSENTNAQSYNASQELDLPKGIEL